MFGTIFFFSVPRMFICHFASLRKVAQDERYSGLVCLSSSGNQAGGCDPEAWRTIVGLSPTASLFF